MSRSRRGHGSHMKPLRVSYSAVHRARSHHRAPTGPRKAAQDRDGACMRKLLTILNAMIRDSREWDPSVPLDQLRLQHSC
jgi:hypothetical protein